MEKITDINRIAKNKNKKIEEEKNILMGNILRKKNKILEEEEKEYISNNLITIVNGRDEGSSRNKRKERVNNKINEGRIKKIKNNRIKNIEINKEEKKEERIQTDINQIKEEIKIKSIVENENFFKKRNRKYIRKNNKNMILNNPKSERVQSQRKSKNIRFDVNLNLNINA